MVMEPHVDVVYCGLPEFPEMYDIMCIPVDDVILDSFVQIHCNRSNVVLAVCF